MEKNFKPTVSTTSVVALVKDYKASSVTSAYTRHSTAQPLIGISACVMLKG